MAQHKDDLGCEKRRLDRSTTRLGVELLAMDKDFHTKFHMCSTEDGLG